MRLGIIGPTQWKKNCKIVHVSEKKYLAETKKIASIVKNLGFEIVVNPHKGSVSQFFAQEIKKLGGKVFGIIPLQDTEFGIEYLDQSVCSEIIDCGTWRNMAEKFNEETHALLCIGFSVGALNEIAFSKWFNSLSKAGESAIAKAIPRKPKKILVIKEFVSAQLPKESVKELRIEYVPLKQLEKKLEKL